MSGLLLSRLIISARELSELAVASRMYQLRKLVTLTFWVPARPRSSAHDARECAPSTVDQVRQNKISHTCCQTRRFLKYSHNISSDFVIFQRSHACRQTPCCAMYRIDLVGVRRSHACTVKFHASRVVFGLFVSSS